MVESLSARGVDIVGGGPGVIQVNLRNLASANGSIEGGKRMLLQILAELNCDAVTLLPEDIGYIMGQNVMSHAISRGLESNVAGLERLLYDVPVSENDPAGDAIPLFDRLDSAIDFVLNDAPPPGADPDALRRGAEADLFRHNLLGDGNDSDHRAWMDGPIAEDPAPLPQEFRTEVRPFKSIFDRSE
jgi:hypothetical protein